MNNSSKSFDRYANLKKNFAPANKSGEAGQIVNEVPAHKTLSDYIRRAKAFDAVANEKKLTFDEWIKVFNLQEDTKQFMRYAWNAAQKNK